MLYRMTLKRSLLFLVLGVLILNALLVFFFGKLLMQRAYVYQKESELIAAYWQLVNSDKLNSAALVGIEDKNFTVTVIDRTDSELIYSTRSSDVEFLENKDEYISRMQRYLIYAGEEPYYIGYDDDTMVSTSGVEQVVASRIALDGSLGSSQLVEITTPIDSLEESAELAVNFSLLASFVAMLVAIVVVNKAATMVTTPLSEATNVAKRITALDFSQKCEVGMDNEIGDLVDSVNQMSDVVQSYTKQLEEANVRLKNDIMEKERNEEARKNLISNISHDLKTPIAIISGYAEGLKSGMAKTEESRGEYCDIISDEADKMLRLIMRMLTLSRLESGMIEPQLEEFDLSELLDYIVSAFGMTFETQGIEYTADYEQGIWIRSDYDLAEQSITNYVQNAVSHIGGAKPRIKVSVQKRGDNYRVSVFNTAPPIPEDELSKIWDSFYKLEKSRVGTRTESGLGLAIVKGDMKLLGMPFGVRNICDGVEFWLEQEAADPQDEFDA